MNSVTTEQTTTVAARGYTRDLPPSEIGAATKRAVIYLRVSTAQQVHTARDSEGFSIPAQREACIRKASAMGASVVEEYVDKGESARTSDRPALQAMLSRLTEKLDIDYVIVHKVDRLARNRADDVNINLAIRKAGAQLVSVTENIDETPSGMLLHGIMSSIAEFYSKNLAAEITKGMNQRAKKGLQPGQAPIGYLNVPEVHEGHEIRTIIVDPERAPHIQWAFETYASGDWNLDQLTEALTERGLRYRATANRPARPMLRSRVAAMLRHEFYVGIVNWGGIRTPGRHEPLVSVETFATVQALLSMRRNGQKERRHRHYLKGSLYCARCEAPLSYSRSRGHGGEYEYFFCLARHERRSNCTLPYLRPEDVEKAVENHYATVRLGSESLKVIREHLLAALRLETTGAEREAKRQRIRITQLEAERRKLLQAHLAGAVPLDLLHEEQDRITRQLASAIGALANTEVHWETVERNLDLALGLAEEPQTAYKLSDAKGRRALNQAFFEGLYIDDPDRVAYARLAEPFAALLAEDLTVLLHGEKTNLGRYRRGRGSSKQHLVGGRGFEPLTPSASIRSGLSITCCAVR